MLMLMAKVSVANISKATVNDERSEASLIDIFVYNVVSLSFPEGQWRSSTQAVSSVSIIVRTKAISLRAFSRMTRGSCEVQRRILGAITIAKLLASIFVRATTSGLANIWNKLVNQVICMDICLYLSYLYYTVSTEKMKISAEKLIVHADL